MNWSVLGHSRNKKYFDNVIKNGVLSHAYLFTGQEMIGKRAFALEILKMINGGEPDSSPDFRLVAPKLSEGESGIYIEDIRKLKSFLSLKPHSGKYKLALIDDAHTLTSEAANALLKVLEEPPGLAVIIMISSMPGLIPQTIASRCEKVRFVKANEKEVRSFLTGKKIKKDEEEFLIKLTGGKIGLINKLIEKDGLQEARKAVDDLRKLLNSGIYERMNYAKKINEDGDYQPRIDHWLNWVSAHLATSPKNGKIVKELLVLSNIVSQPQYNHRLALENFLINL